MPHPYNGGLTVWLSLLVFFAAAAFVIWMIWLA